MLVLIRTSIFFCFLCGLSSSSLKKVSSSICQLKIKQKGLSPAAEWQATTSHSMETLSSCGALCQTIRTTTNSFIFSPAHTPFTPWTSSSGHLRIRCRRPLRLASISSWHSCSARVLTYSSHLSRFALSKKRKIATNQNTQAPKSVAAAINRRRQATIGVET